MKKTILILWALLFICSSAHAYETLVPGDLPYVKAIVGEALPDYQSMYAIACAIRNRGTLQGVYGLHAKHVETASEFVFGKAELAWRQSAIKPDVVKGATHWLSDYDLKHSKPKRIAFRKQMIETAYIGQTHFYRKK